LGTGNRVSAVSGFAKSHPIDKSLPEPIQEVIQELRNYARSPSVKSRDDFIYDMTKGSIGRGKWDEILDVGVPGVRKVVDLANPTKRVLRVLEAEDPQALKKVEAKAEVITVYRLVSKGNDTSLKIGDSNIYLARSDAKMWKGWDEDVTGGEYEVIPVKIKKEDLTFRGGTELGYSPKEFRDTVVSLKKVYDDAMGIDNSVFEGKIPADCSWLVKEGLQCETVEKFIQKINENARPSRLLKEVKNGDMVLISAPKEYGVNFGVVQEKKGQQVFVESVMNNKKRLVALPYNSKASSKDISFLAGKSHEFITSLWEKVHETGGNGLIDDGFEKSNLIESDGEIR
jgi:hypothetical protein